jgi:hypothetical protein
MTSVLASLECPICLQLYSSPRVLTNCGHSLCTSCIDVLSTTPSMVECPLCETATYYARVEDMQLNFALLGILEALVIDKAELDQAIRSEITMEDLQDCFDEEPDNDDGEADGCCPWRCFKSTSK